jgi:hypothetical protein
MARELADKIETYDAIVFDANRDGNEDLAESVIGYTNMIAEGARRSFNALAASLGLGTALNWDQSQSGDMDFLNEMSALGAEVKKLNKRNRLISAQAAISATTGNFAIGDVDEYGDEELAEHLVGDVFSTLASRRLPGNLMGNFAPLATSSAKASEEMGKAILKKAGASIDSSGVPVNTGKGDGLLAKVLGKINKHPKLAMGLAAGVPALALTLGPLIKLLRGRKQVGDVGWDESALEAMYGDIADGYGEEYADAWLAGDIDSIALNAFMDANDTSEDQFGDVDHDAVSLMIDDEYGDILSSVTPEIGGPFARFAANRAKRRAARQQRRAIKRNARTLRRTNKQNAKTARRAARQARKMTRQSRRGMARDARLASRLANRGAVAPPPVPVMAEPEYQEPYYDDGGMGFEQPYYDQGYSDDTYDGGFDQGMDMTDPGWFDSDYDDGAAFSGFDAYNSF